MRSTMDKILTKEFLSVKRKVIRLAKKKNKKNKKTKKKKKKNKTKNKTKQNKQQQKRCMNNSGSFNQHVQIDHTGCVGSP